MKVLHKLKALFVKNAQPVVLDLCAAEIKGGRAYLHPKGNHQITYLVRSDDIEICLNGNKELSDDDILVIKKQEDPSIAKKDRPSSNKQVSGNNENNSESYEDVYDRFKKKTFSVSLYQYEYDTLMSTIKEYGYRRADFILASANTATRGTMEREHKKLVKVHKELRKEEKQRKQI